MGARKFQLFTNMNLTRATSFAWAKLYVSVCRFQLFTNMDLTRMELKFDDWNETP